MTRISTSMPISRVPAVQAKNEGLSFAYPFTQAPERLQRVVHWSETTYPEVVSHGHGQHDFYVEHAQPELRLRILYTKISLTWSLELGGML